MESSWNRILIGCLAVIFVLSGIAIAVFDEYGNVWCGSFIRAGALLGAFWIGMPTRGRAAAWARVSPYWIIAAAAGVVVLGRVIRHPQTILPIIGAFFVLSWLWPYLAGRHRPS